MLPSDFILLLAPILAAAAVGFWWGRQRAEARIQQLSTSHAAAVNRLQWVEELRATQAQEIAQLEQEHEEWHERLAQAQSQVVGLQERLQASQSQAEGWALQAREVFQGLASSVLHQSQQQLLETAQQHWGSLSGFLQTHWTEKNEQLVAGVTPVSQAIERLEARINEVERQRSGAYEGLQVQLRQLMQSEQTLQVETARLVQALKAPQVRGRWGEIQLRRVVELAGMLSHCDFMEQSTMTNDEGRQLRPDMVIRLPGDRYLVVDAKAPLDAYLRAQDATDENERRKCLLEHAQRIRQHITELSGKRYWQQFETMPEFVVLFLPGETFFSAALQVDPGLIEEGVHQKVILATPTTLIALLRSAAYGWSQMELSKNAIEISTLGKELYKRLSDFGRHWSGLGKDLERAMRSYNQAAGSLERRVFVTARRFRDLQVGVEDTLPEVPSLEEGARLMGVPEWLEVEPQPVVEVPGEA